MRMMIGIGMPKKYSRIERITFSPEKSSVSRPAGWPALLHERVE
jgi:hypothetical protein